MKHFDQEKNQMNEEKQGWWAKFTSKVWFTLPFGNDGRGTPVKVFPFVFMGIFVTGIVIFDTFFVG